MPELPEVETVRRGLAGHVVGARIDEVVYGRLRTLRRYDNPQTFVDELLGARINRTERIGKYLLLRLHDERALVVHLRMSGQLLWVPPAVEEPLRKHTHVQLRFDSGGELRFVDPRTFGEMFVVDADLSPLAHLGPDALEQVATPAELAARLSGRRAALKTVLLDQTVIAGVGSIYADELCFRAGVRPGRATDTLRRIDISRIHTSMKDVLGEAVAAGGSTLGDGQYVGVDGQPGTFAECHGVHARAGEPCLVCGSLIRTGTVGQRSAYWCPRCQR